MGLNHENVNQDENMASLSSPEQICIKKHDNVCHIHTGCEPDI